MTVAILNPIPVEYQATLAQLPHWKEHIESGERYLTGQINGRYGIIKVIAQKVGSRNETVALATERIINRFRPMVIILSGVAGGVKDVSIGDVVVAERYYGFDTGKVTDAGYVARPISGHYSSSLLALAQSVADKEDWRSRTNSAGSTEVVFGIIAASNKVIASSKSELYQRLKLHFNDTTAIEMEAAGFGQALLPYHSIHSINIRGISDLLDGKSSSDAAGSQEIAAKNAAAFVFELLSQLNISNFKTNNMGAKDLAKEIMGLILPLIKIESVQEIGEDMKDATNGSVRELWKKVKPLFIEEYDALVSTPKDEDVLADARSELRRTLKRKPDLQKELTEMVEEIKKRQPEAQVNITNSKNVVQGSNISVGGDFRLGDG